MERIEIISSLLTSVGWIDGQLEVEFRSNGEVWRYPTVDRETYDEMMGAETPSAGKYFIKHIRAVHVGQKM